METSRSISIKKKLTIATATVTVVVLVLASIGFITYDTRSFREGMIRELTTFGQVIGNNASAALVFQDEGSAKEILSALNAKTHIVTAALYERFSSRGEADYQNRLLSAMRYEFGGHLEKAGK